MYRKPNTDIHREASWAYRETNIYSHIDIGVIGKPNVGIYCEVALETLILAYTEGHF